METDPQKLMQMQSGDDDRMRQMNEMRNRMQMMQGQHEQAAGQYQGGLALPEQLPQGQVDPRMLMMLKAKMYQGQQQDPGASSDMQMERSMPNPDMQRQMAMRNQQMQQQHAPQQQMVGQAPQRQMPDPSMMRNQMQQMQGQQQMLGQQRPQMQQRPQGAGMPANAAMANRAMRPRMRMGMQRPQQQSGEVANPNAAPAGRSVTPF